jgi:hypothetical protein
MVFVAILLASGSQAQIGQSPEACSTQWGAPVSGQVHTNGYGILNFSQDNLLIEAEFVAGTAQRITYRNVSQDKGGISKLLDSNADSSQWHAWSTPGLPPSGNDPQKWMRSDEMAMAELSADGLAILGAGWYQHLASPPPADGTNRPLPEAVASTPVLPAPAAPARHDGIEGLWQCDMPNGVTTVLDIQPNAELTWIRLGKTERREWKARWTKQPGEGPRTYALTEAVSTNSGPARVFGTFYLSPEPRLGFLAKETLSKMPAAARRAIAAPQLDFERIAVMPRWKPAAPGTMPVKGMSREDAIRLLGKPAGRMSSGKQEVLSYPWGNVWMDDGVVSRIE